MKNLIEAFAAINKIAALIIITFSIAALPIVSFAQYPNEENDTQVRISKDVSLPDYIGVPHDVSIMCHDFFRYLVAGKAELAFDKILTNSPIGNKKEQNAKRVATFNKAVEVYGAAKSHELSSVEQVSESLLKIRFITLHEQFPLRWFFTFYKSPVRGWIVINMTFDDDIEYLFSKN